jgi:hypothetical protein
MEQSGHYNSYQIAWDLRREDCERLVDKRSTVQNYDSKRQYCSWLPAARRAACNGYTALTPVNPSVPTSVLNMTFSP